MTHRGNFYVKTASVLRYRSKKTDKHAEKEVTRHVALWWLQRNGRRRVDHNEQMDLSRFLVKDHRK